MARTVETDAALSRCVHEEIIATTNHRLQPTPENAAALLKAQAACGEAWAAIYRNGPVLFNQKDTR